MALPKPYYREGKGEREIVIYHGDCQAILPELPAGSVDLVLTDPPYAREHAVVWNHLADLVPRVMGEDAFLVTLLGHYQLPRVVNLLGQALRFYWLAVTENNNCPIMHGFRVQINYKPVLIYRKGEARPQRIWRDRFNVAANVAKWKIAKMSHKWGQAESLFYEPCDAFCPVGGLVLDPFLGGGTTLLVARDMDRRAIGIDIEEGCCEVAARRLAQGVFDWEETSKSRNVETSKLDESVSLLVV